MPKLTSTKIGASRQHRVNHECSAFTSTSWLTDGSEFYLDFEIDNRRFHATLSREETVQLIQNLSEAVSDIAATSENQKQIPRNQKRKPKRIPKPKSKGARK